MSETAVPGRGNAILIFTGLTEHFYLTSQRPVVSKSKIPSPIPQSSSRCVKCEISYSSYFEMMTSHLHFAMVHSVVLHQSMLKRATGISTVGWEGNTSVQWTFYYADGFDKLRTALRVSRGALRLWKMLLDAIFELKERCLRTWSVVYRCSPILWSLGTIFSWKSILSYSSTSLWSIDLWSQSISSILLNLGRLRVGRSAELSCSFKETFDSWPWDVACCMPSTCLHCV